MLSGQKKISASAPPAHTGETRHSFQGRFSNPIVKVSLSEGVLINRLQSFWSTQNMQTLDITTTLTKTNIFPS